jgi:putative hydrolase of the HAD superfamily
MRAPCCAGVPPSRLPAVVFFDVGGTLLNFNIEPSHLFARIVSDHGISVEPASLYRTMREVEARYPVPLGASAQSEADYWRAYDGKILEGLGLDSNQALLDEIARRFVEELTLEAFPESLAVLERIRALGVPLGVISNASHGILGDLERNGMAPFFTHIVYSQAVGAAKPDPRIFEEALRRFGVEAPSTWHVGDNPQADIEGARAVGIRPVLVDRAGRHAAVEAHRVADLRGVVSMLEEA